MAERTQRVPQPQGEKKTVLYGIGKAVSSVPEAHSRLYMALYDELLAKSPHTPEEAAVARKTRSRIETVAKIAGWGTTAVWAGLVSLAAAKGYSWLKDRPPVPPRETSPAPVLSVEKTRPVAADLRPRTEHQPARAEQSAHLLFPGTLVPANFDYEGAKKEFTKLYDALHMRMSVTDEARADALFVAAVANDRNAILHDYPRLITDMHAINVVLQSMSGHPEEMRKLARFLPSKTGGMKPDLTFYRNPLNMVRNRFALCQPRMDGTSPLQAWNRYSVMRFAALGRFFDLKDMNDPQGVAMMRVFEEANPTFAWNGDFHKVR